MRRCPKCNCELPEQAKFCLECGTPQPALPAPEGVAEPPSVVKKNAGRKRKTAAEPVRPAASADVRSTGTAEADGPLPRRRRAAYATVIAAVVVFILVVTVIALVFADRQRETNPYVFYTGNGELKAAHLNEEENTVLSTLTQTAYLPDWYYQMVHEGRTLFFADPQEDRTYNLKRVELSNLFNGTGAPETVAEGVSGPYIVTTNGTALYTIDRTLFLTDAEGQRKLKDGVRQFRLSGNEKVAVCIDRAGHVVQLPFAESSDSETVFPESADALHWVNEDGTVVYTQKGEVRIKQLRNETRPIFKDADGYLPVTEDGKFYYWKNEIIKISLAEMVSDRNRVADERMVEPTRPTRPEPPIDRSSTAPTDLVVVPESSETEPTPAGTTPVEETKKDADSLRHPPAAVPMAQLPEPTPGQVGQTTTTAGQSQPTEGESGSSEGESGSSEESTPSRSTSDKMSKPTALPKTTPATTVDPHKVREELQAYRDQMDEYLAKLDRDERRARLAKEFLELQVSQLWYYDGERVAKIDTGMGHLIAASPDASAMIYDVSSAVPQDVDDVADVTDFNKLKTDVMKGAERGYRLVSRGITSALAPAGPLTDVVFSKNGTRITYIYGETAQLTDVYLENNVVFDKVVLDSNVIEYAYNATGDRLLYYKEDEAGERLLFENGRRLADRVDQAEAVRNGVVCLANVNPSTKMGDLLRISDPDSEPVRIAGGVSAFYSTSGNGVVYLQVGLSSEGELRYSKNGDRSILLDTLGGEIQLLEVSGEKKARRDLFDSASDILLED